MRHATVLTVVLALLAGCGGLVATPDQSTVTPAPVPTDDAVFPAGVSETSVVPSVVATQHARVLATTNFTLESTRRVVGPNGTVLRTTTETRRATSERRRYAGQFRRTEGDTATPTKAVDYWVDESIIVVRSRQAGVSVDVSQWPRNDTGPVWDLTGRLRLEATLRAVDAEPRERTAGGLLVVSTGVRDPTALWTPPDISAPTNVSARIHVRPDGVVTIHHVEYDAVLSGTRVHVTQVTRIDAIGRTTVTRPAWVTRVDEAR